MSFDVEEKRGVHVIRVRDPKLTYPLLGSFFSDLKRLVEGGAGLVALDLGAVTYLDSAAIGCLMDVHRLLKEAGGVVRLFGLQPRVRTMMSMTGVLRIVEAHEDEADALQAFAAEGGKEG